MRPATIPSESLSEHALGDLVPDPIRKTTSQHKKIREMKCQNGDKNSKNILDESVPEHGDAPATLVCQRGMKYQERSIHTYFLKDRNCEKRTGEASPRAEKYGDLRIAEHKVLTETCEPRNIH